MPNWCYNELEVSGNCNSLEELQQLFEDGFSLEKITPTPPELIADAGREKDKMPLWYEWRLKNWGTKWDIMEEDFDDDTQFTATENNSIQAKFHTAWQPPMFALATLSKKFKDLKFKLCYLDEMMNFRGRAEIEDGNVSDDHHRFTEEEYKEMMEERKKTT